MIGYERLHSENPGLTVIIQLCSMLQNDIKEGGGENGFVIPMTPAVEDVAVSPKSPTSPVKSRFRAGSKSVSSSDYMQQFRQGFVSYGEFLASYWVHLPQTLTRALGESTRSASSPSLIAT